MTAGATSTRTRWTRRRLLIVRWSAAAVAIAGFVLQVLPDLIGLHTGWAWWSLHCVAGGAIGVGTVACLSTFRWFTEWQRRRSNR